MNNIRNKIIRDQIVFDDENNPSTSMADIIWPRTVLDAVFDHNDPNEITLREILDDMKQQIKDGGTGYIKFPVASVNGMYDDVVIAKQHIGLARVNNTSDMEKPLSDPQRNAVLGILADYNFNVDLSDLISHLTDYNNPHKMTTDQLNFDGSLSNLIDNLLSVHDMSNAAHSDIRTNITNLTSQLNVNTDSLDQRITALLDNYTSHLTSPSSHQTLFGVKENLSNKATIISKTSNYSDTKYPSSKAVVDYVAAVTAGMGGGSSISNYVAYLDILNGDLDLPVASEAVYQQAFLIRNRNNSIYSGIAVCRKNGSTYWWDIKNFTVSKYDSKYFVETANGLSIDITSLPQPIDSYDKMTSDQKYLQGTTIRPGTNPGTISYFVNNNISTLVDNIAVKGLAALAYKSTINSTDIADYAILSNHLSDNCVSTENIADNSITPDKLAGDIISNANLITGSVDSRTIMEKAVTTEKISEFAITNNRLAPECIDSFKMQAGAVTTYNLANNAVSTDKLQNQSVTTDKLDMGAVNNSKLSNMPAYSMKGNMTNGWNSPDDISFASIIDSFISTATTAQLQSLGAKLKPYVI